jgi:hypothetical protein
MRRETVIANWGRPAGGPMTDEERRAMFWRMAHGKGGGGNPRAPSTKPESVLPDSKYGPGWKPGTTDPTGKYGPGWAPSGALTYDDSKPKWRNWLSAAWDGFKEGAEGAAIIEANTLSYGLNDNLRKAADSYQGADYDAVRIVSKVGRFAIETYVTAGTLSKLSMAWNASKFAATATGKAVGALTPLATTIGGFSAKDALEDYIYANPTMDPRKEKTLSIAADIAGYVGAMGLVTTVGGALGWLSSKIPVSAKLTKPALDKLQKVFTSAKDENGIRALSTLTSKGKLSLLGAAKTVVAGIDKGASFLGSKIGIAAKTAFPKTTRLLSNLHKAYTGFSNWTGSTLKELKSGAFVPAKHAAAKKLTAQAANLRTQADIISTTSNFKLFGKPSTYGVSNIGEKKAFQTGYFQRSAKELTKSASEKIKSLLKLKTPAASNAAKSLAKESKKVADAVKNLSLKTHTPETLAAAQKALKTDSKKLYTLVTKSEGASSSSIRFARDAKTNFKAGLEFERQSKNQIRKLLKEADTLEGTAKNLAARTKEAILKSAYVVGMGNLTYNIEEHGSGRLGKAIGWGKGIDAYEKEARAKFEKGEQFDVPKDSPRGILGMLSTFTVGIQGNPMEKLTRGGWAREQAEQGAYRAKYAMIDEALAAGKITPKQAKFEHEKLIDEKPWRMQGRSAWDVAPALSSFINWKVGDIQSKARRSTYETLKYVHDGDTIKTEESGLIRASRYNTREMARQGNPVESYAQQATDLVKSRMGPFATIDEKTGERLQKPLYEQSLIERMGGKPKIRIVADSNWKARQATDTGSGNRPVASYEIPRSKLGELFSRIPILRTMVPMQDIGEEVVAQGLGALRYKNLSGRTDKDKVYGKLQEAAIAAKLNLFSPEAQADPSISEWAGKERYTKEPPPQPWRGAGNFWGSGLMAAGNSGIFSQMPMAGTITAQAWNALLAGIGVGQFNEGARIAPPKTIYPVSSIRTAERAEERQNADEAIDGILSRHPEFQRR